MTFSEYVFLTLTRFFKNSKFNDTFFLPLISVAIEVLLFFLVSFSFKILAVEIMTKRRKKLI